MRPTTVTVNLSHRHIHLTEADVEILFGARYKLTKKVDLLQPGQFAAQETVTIQGPSGSLEHVRVVGPTRSATQCEILAGDVYKLGFAATEVPVRLSGAIADSAGFTIVGPAGSVEKSEGLIIAQRHIHVDPETAARHHLTDGTTVSITLATPLRETTYGAVAVRVHTNAMFECHLDIEEGNAAGIRNGYQATIVR